MRLRDREDEPTRRRRGVDVVGHEADRDSTLRGQLEEPERLLRVAVEAAEVVGVDGRGFAGLDGLHEAHVLAALLDLRARHVDA